MWPQCHFFPISKHKTHALLLINQQFTGSKIHGPLYATIIIQKDLKGGITEKPQENRFPIEEIYAPQMLLNKVFVYSVPA